MFKRAIVETLHGGLMSVMVPSKALPRIVIGDTFLVTSDIDLMPYCVVSAGLTGHVVYTGEATGEIEIEMDTRIPGLRSWDNAFTLVPFETEAAIASLQHVSFVKLYPKGKRPVPDPYPSQEVRQCS